MADSALAFVGEINNEHEEVTKGESAALSHAIKCGKLLNLARENVKAEKGKWGAWLSQHCPKIPQTTASLYMRLAESENVIAKATSIRAAIQVLGTTRERTEPNKLRLEPTKAKGGSADLATLFQNSAPDEINIAMKNAGVLEKVRDRMFQGFDPKGLSVLLLKMWQPAELKELANLLMTGVRERPAVPASIAVVSTAAQNATVMMSKRPSS